MKTNIAKRSDRGLGWPRVDIFKGKDNQFYWRRVARNGQIESVGGEGYTRAFDAHRAAVRVNTKSLPMRCIFQYGRR